METVPNAPWGYDVRASARMTLNEEAHMIGFRSTSTRRVAMGVGFVAITSLVGTVVE